MNVFEVTKCEKISKEEIYNKLNKILDNEQEKFKNHRGFDQSVLKAAIELSTSDLYMHNSDFFELSKNGRNYVGENEIIKNSIEKIVKYRKSSNTEWHDNCYHAATLGLYNILYFYIPKAVKDY